MTLSHAVESSYRILRDFGNTIGCSIPLMLADPVDRIEGESLLVAFGLSFSCAACILTIPQGRWKPQLKAKAMKPTFVRSISELVLKARRILNAKRYYI
jgi:hypothetical protein